MLIPSIGDFYFSTYEEFLNGLCKVNWLDPSNKGTREEQEEVLRILWNFSAEQEEKEEGRQGRGRQGQAPDNRAGRCRGAGVQP